MPVSTRTPSLKSAIYEQIARLGQAASSPSRLNQASEGAGHLPRPAAGRQGSAGRHGSAGASRAAKGAWGAPGAPQL